MCIYMYVRIYGRDNGSYIALGHRLIGCSMHMKGTT